MGVEIFNWPTDYYLPAGPLHPKWVLLKFLQLTYCLRIRILFSVILIAYEMGVTIFNELSILLQSMTNSPRDNTPGGSCGDIFLKAQS